MEPPVQQPEIEPAPPALALPRLAAPLFRLDPGWLFLVSGIALIASTVLIPAFDDLRQAEWNRDRARAAEQYRRERLTNYVSYLDAVRAENRTLVLSLAATQLNIAPTNKQPMLDTSQPGLPDVDLFSALEPSLAVVPAPATPRSLLQRWATGQRTRPWLLGAGGLLMLLGLLPASVRRWN